MYATVISRPTLVENRLYDGSKRLADGSLMEAPAYDYRGICLYKSIYLYIYIYITNTQAGSSLLPKSEGGPASVALSEHATNG